MAVQPSPHKLLVIGAGFPRTGTASLKEALQILLWNGDGEPGLCYHMYEIMKDGPVRPDHMKVWLKVYGEGWDAHAEEARRMLEPFNTAVDLPAMAFWKELLQQNPDAKVVLSVRDNFEVWHKSMLETIYVANKMFKEMPHGLRDLLLPVRFFRLGVCKQFFDEWFQGKFEDPAFARQVYEAHHAEVKSTVPKDQLLVYNVKEGWEPLCKFLGVPVPKEPFPNVNDTKDFKEKVHKSIGTIKTALWCVHHVLLAGAVAGAGAAVTALLRGTRRA